MLPLSALRSALSGLPWQKESWWWSAWAIVTDIPEFLGELFVYRSLGPYTERNLGVERPAEITPWSLFTGAAELKIADAFPFRRGVDVRLWAALPRCVSQAFGVVCENLSRCPVELLISLRFFLCVTYSSSCSFSAPGHCCSIWSTEETFMWSYKTAGHLDFVGFVFRNPS